MAEGYAHGATAGVDVEARFSAQSGLVPGEGEICERKRQKIEKGREKVKVEWEKIRGGMGEGGWNGDGESVLGREKG